MLDKCVVSQDPDFTEVFEVLEWSKESLLIKVRKFTVKILKFGTPEKLL